MDAGGDVVECLDIDDGIVMRSESEIDSVCGRVICLDIVDGGIIARSFEIYGCLRLGGRISRAEIFRISFDIVDDDVAFVVGVEYAVHTASSCFGESRIVGAYERDAVSVEDESVAYASDAGLIFAAGEDIYSMILEIIGAGECAGIEIHDLESGKRASVGQSVLGERGS